VSRLRAAAQAHSVSISPSQRLPLVGLPERRLPPVMLLPGQRPAQEARWPAVGKTDMSTPSLAMMASAARLPTPVMVAEPVTGHGERGDHRIDAAVEGGDRLLQVLEVVKGQPDQQPMMLAEAAPQGLAQLGKLGPQAAPGQLRQDLPVAFAGNQSAQHRPARDAQDVGGDRVQLDASVLQGLLDPLALGPVRLDEPLAVADKIPQLPDRRRGHEAAPQQPTLQQLTQPGGIADVGLAAGQDPGRGGR
jgi:hypothetical protein